MATVQTFACDVCGIQKAPSNNWLKAFFVDPENKQAGLTIVAWNIENVAGEALMPEQADAHLCGAAHAIEWISKQLFSS